MELPENPPTAPGTVLETARLRLRRFTAADLDDLAALYGDPVVMRFIDDGRPYSRDRVEREAFPAILREYEQLPAGLGRYAVEDLATNRFLGRFSLRPANSPGLDADEGLEVGYRLRPDAWGRGYATEGARALVDTAFTSFGAQRVVATTMTVNTASRRVMERVGLRYVRSFFIDWGTPIEGADQGDVVYALDRADWQRRSEGAGRTP